MVIPGLVPQERPKVQHRDYGICPSASGGVAESMIIGFIGPDGRVAPIPTPIPLTVPMRDSIGDRPERIFRLAAPCTGVACVQWDRAGCGLIGFLQASLADQPAALVTQCAIRSSCVWFQDAGLDACRICPSVTYNPVD